MCPTGRHATGWTWSTDEPLEGAAIQTKLTMGAKAARIGLEPTSDRQQNDQRRSDDRRGQTRPRPQPMRQYRFGSTQRRERGGRIATRVVTGKVIYAISGYYTRSIRRGELKHGEHGEHGEEEREEIGVGRSMQCVVLALSAMIAAQKPLCSYSVSPPCSPCSPCFNSPRLQNHR